MKISIVLAIMLSVSACGQQTAAFESSEAQTSGWSAQERGEVKRNCENTVTNSSPKFSGSYASTYCACVFDSITSRWSHAELQQQEVAIIEFLTTEGTMAKCLEAGQSAQADEDSSRAEEAGMPVEILGARLEMSLEELRRIRPGAKENDGTLSERVIWKQHEFDASYSINPMSKRVMLISLERRSSREMYVEMQSQLNDDFGPLTAPAEIDLWLLRSERSAGGIVISHGLKAEAGGALTEAVMLSKDY